MSDDDNPAKRVKVTEDVDEEVVDFDDDEDLAAQREAWIEQTKALEQEKKEQAAASAEAASGALDANERSETAASGPSSSAPATPLLSGQDSSLHPSVSRKRKAASRGGSQPVSLLGSPMHTPIRFPDAPMFHPGLGISPVRPPMPGMMGFRGPRPHRSGPGDGAPGLLPTPVMGRGRPARPGKPQRPEDNRWRAMHQLQMERAKRPDLRSGLSRHSKPIYDFSVETNIKIDPDETILYDKNTTSTIEAEAARVESILKLQAFFGKTCVEKLNLQSQPRLAFQRWIMSQLCQRGDIEAKDPLLKKPSVAVEEDVLARELSADIPLRLPGPTRKVPVPLGISYIRKYLQAAEWWLYMFESRMGVTKMDEGEDEDAPQPSIVESEAADVKQSEEEAAGTDGEKGVGAEEQPLTMESKLEGEAQKPADEAAEADRKASHDDAGTEMGEGEGKPEGAEVENGESAKSEDGPQAHSAGQEAAEAGAAAVEEKPNEADKATGKLTEEQLELIEGIKRRVSEARQWLREHRAGHYPREDLSRRDSRRDRRRDYDHADIIAMLRKKCTPLFAKLVTQDIAETCQLLVDEAEKSFNELSSKYQPVDFPVKREDVAIERGDKVSRIVVTGTDILLTINNSHLDKLEQLYKRHSASKDEELEGFKPAMVSMLLRYRACMGSESEGADFHQAVPESLCALLAKEFGVSMELFSSPLSTYFADFCSPFPDTDAAFGSVGSFFTFAPTAGAFLVHPPHTVECLERTSARLLRLLRRTDEALTFFVLYPEWKDMDAVTGLIDSDYRRAVVTFEWGRHRLVTGLQHQTEAVHQMRWNIMKRRHLLIVLQTRAAVEANTPTRSRLQAIERVMNVV